MKDNLSKQQRSMLMAKVKSKGNNSTELAFLATLKAKDISGWRRHPKNIPGRPDFYFPHVKLAVFVDGCFWHSCQKCGRIPKTNIDFWTTKLEYNKQRDVQVRHALLNKGFFLIRIWEHELNSNIWLNRLTKKMRFLSSRLI